MEVNAATLERILRDLGCAEANCTDGGRLADLCPTDRQVVACLVKQLIRHIEDNFRQARSIAEYQQEQEEAAKEDRRLRAELAALELRAHEQDAERQHTLAELRADAERDRRLYTQRVCALGDALAHAQAERAKLNDQLTRAPSESASNLKTWLAQAVLTRAQSDSDEADSRLAQSQSETRQGEALLAKAKSEIAALKTRLAQAHTDKTELEDLLARAQLNADEFNARTAQSQSEARDMEVRLARAESKATELTAQLAQPQSETREMEARLAHAHSKMAELDDRLQRAESERSDLEAQLAHVQLESRESSTRLAQVHSDRREMEAHLAQARSETTELNGRLKRADAERSGLKGKLAHAQLESGELGARLAQEAKEIAGRLAQAHCEVAELTDRLTQSQLEARDTEAHLVETHSVIAELRSQLAHAQSARNETDARLALSQTEIAELTARLTTERSERGDKEDKLARAQALCGETETRIASAHALGGELEGRLEAAQFTINSLEARLRQSEERHEFARRRHADVMTGVTSRYERDERELRNRMERAASAHASLVQNLQAARGEAHEAQHTARSLANDVKQLRRRLRGTETEVCGVYGKNKEMELRFEKAVVELRAQLVECEEERDVLKRRLVELYKEADESREEARKRGNLLVDEIERLTEKNKALGEALGVAVKERAVVGRKCDGEGADRGEEVVEDTELKCAAAGREATTEAEKRHVEEVRALRLAKRELEVEAGRAADRVTCLQDVLGLLLKENLLIYAEKRALLSRALHFREKYRAASEQLLRAGAEGDA